MKKSSFIIIVFILITIQHYAQSKNFIDQPYLETKATVDTLVVPDKIYLSITISEKDTKGKKSVEELEKSMHDKLVGIGIDIKKQLSLSDASTNFKKIFLRKKDVFKNKNYELLVYDAKTVGKVILGLEAIDIANVYIDGAEYSKIEDLKIKLKQKAITKAKLQAESLLEPLNQNLGKAIYISDSNMNITHRLRGKALGVNVRSYSSLQEASTESLNIDFEKIKVESTVNVNFKIE